MIGTKSPKITKDRRRVKPPTRTQEAPNVDSSKLLQNSTWISLHGI